MKIRSTLVLHGGAEIISKENISVELELQYREELAIALEAGYSILDQGGTSMDAIIKTIQIMEESHLFNAGKGSVFTHDEKNELDASIMDGKTGMAGAIAGVTRIKSPIRAAHKVMTQSKHVFLSGSGAEEFADKQGLEMVDNSYFSTEKQLNKLRKVKQKELDKTKLTSEKLGTVGAVALDQYGNLAAGTSTGGIINKRYGRIGDSPIIGSGTFAENESCAVSSTGHGEYFIRNVIAYDISAQMKYQNKTVQQASDHAIFERLERKNGKGGVIVLDAKGNFNMSFNTEVMYRGYIKEKGKPNVFIYKNN